MPIFSISDFVDLIPAVSLRMIGYPSKSSNTSKISLVVPGSLVTIATFLSDKKLINELFPTLGRPIRVITKPFLNLSPNELDLIDSFISVSKSIMFSANNLSRSKGRSSSEKSINASNFDNKNTILVLQELTFSDKTPSN